MVSVVFTSGLLAEPQFDALPVTPRSRYGRSRRFDGIPVAIVVVHVRYNYSRLNNICGSRRPVSGTQNTFCSAAHESRELKTVKLCWPLAVIRECDTRHDDGENAWRRTTRLVREFQRPPHSALFVGDTSSTFDTVRGTTHVRAMCDQSPVGLPLARPAPPRSFPLPPSPFPSTSSAARRLSPALISQL